MVKILYLIFSIIFASLFSFGSKEASQKSNEQLMAEIVNRSIKQLQNRYRLIPIGSGGANVDNKSKREYIAFQLYQKITKEEARILIVEMVELFLNNINENLDLKSYMHDYPFTYKNLEFRVFILDKDGSDTFHPDLGLVSLAERGTVTFVTYKKGALCSRVSNIEESYEQTYKIVMQTQHPGNSVD